MFFEIVKRGKSRRFDCRLIRIRIPSSNDHAKLTDYAGGDFALVGSAALAELNYLFVLFGLTKKYMKKNQFLTCTEEEKKEKKLAQLHEFSKYKKDNRLFYFSNCAPKNSPGKIRRL